MHPSVCSFDPPRSVKKMDYGAPHPLIEVIAVPTTLPLCPPSRPRS